MTPEAESPQVEAVRQQVADTLNGGLIRQLEAVSLTASSYQRRTEEPLLQQGLGLIAKWIDDAAFQLRSSMLGIGMPTDDPAQPSAPLGRVIARLSTLGSSALALGTQTADPYVQGRLLRFVATLDQAIADLRCLGADDIADPASATSVMADIVDAAPDGMLLVDEDGRMLVVNRQVEAIFGYPWEELLGQPVEMLMPEGIRASHNGHRARYTAHPSSRPMGIGLVLSGLRRDGSEFPLEISLSPLHTAEGLRTIATVRDITDRVEGEEQLRQVEQDLAVASDRQRIARTCTTGPSSDSSPRAWPSSPSTVASRTPHCGGGSNRSSMTSTPPSWTCDRPSSS